MRFRRQTPQYRAILLAQDLEHRFPSGVDLPESPQLAVRRIRQLLRRCERPVTVFGRQHAGLTNTHEPALISTAFGGSALSRQLAMPNKAGQPRERPDQRSARARAHQLPPSGEEPLWFSEN